jgi:DNA-binding protein HU-beta
MINDFGKFKKVDRPARKGRNPFTGETIQIKASKKVRFLPAKGLKDVISGAKKLGAAPVAPAKAAPAKASKPAKAAKATKAKKVSKLKKAVKKAKPAKKAKAKKRR